MPTVGNMMRSINLKKTTYMAESPILKQNYSKRPDRLFAENVWLFIANTDRVLGDSRLAHAVVPVSNAVWRSWGIAPWRISVTLGAYLKWWRDCPRESHDAEGRPLWRILSFPFYDYPKSASVSRDGESVEGCTLNVSAKSAWTSLKAVAGEPGYADAVDTPCQLQDVVDILSREEALRNPYIATLQNRLRRSESEAEDLHSQVRRITGELAGSRLEQISLLVELNRDAVAGFLTEYDRRLKEYRRFTARYFDERKSLKEQRRQGSLSGDDCARRLAHMRERKQSMKAEVELFGQSFIDRLDGGRCLSMTIDKIKELNSKLIMAQSSDTIILLDGTPLECFPLATLSEPIEGDPNWVGNKYKPGQTPEEYRKERDRADRLFYGHVNLFLANADRILSDSRMFLTPVDVVNGMAYTGPFGTPTLGVYIEWWLHHREASFDKKGNPIWRISGSALSGASACSSVDPDGKSISAELKGRFHEVRDSFLEVKRRYKHAAGRYVTFTLQEVIDSLEDSANNIH